MLVAAFVVPVVAGALITRGVIHLASVYGLYDAPGAARRIHAAPVPRLGGVAVFAAMLLGLGAAAGTGSIVLDEGSGRFYLGIMLAGGWLCLVGVVDDVRGLRPGTKLLAQAAAGVVLFLCGIRLDSLVFGPAAGGVLQAASLPLTVLWVVTITNAFNLIDGLDGLATGVAVVALLSIVVISAVLGRSDVLVVSLALCGALLGFLRYNFTPARIFLGDSGSLFIGCMLAVLSVHELGNRTAAALGVAPLFALALPLVDTSVAVLRRWLRGVPFSVADRRHIHHQLLARGLTHLRAVLVLWVVAASLAALGLLIAFAPTNLMSLTVVAAGALSALVLLGGLAYLRYHEFTEALSVLVWAPGRFRKVIRDQIHARDIAQVLGVARSLDEVNAVLQDGAPEFAFLGMQVCREGDAARDLLELRDGGTRAWKLDYPVSPDDWPGHDLMVLRIWCRADGARPYGAERVARVLAPMVQTWLVNARPLAAVAEAPEVTLRRARFGLSA